MLAANSSRRTSLLLSIVLFTAFSVAQQPAPVVSGIAPVVSRPQPQPERTRAAANSFVSSGSPSATFAVLIGPGDLLEIGVFETPELAGKVRVNNAGEITLPLIGTVPVAGLKPEEAQALIASKLISGNFLKNPQVSVFIAEYATQGVAVMGEVARPGIFPALGSHKLLDYISLAGGLTQVAGTKITIIRRGHPEKPETVKMVSGPARSENNVEINSGDTVIVERAGIVYVVGEVNRPGGFVMDRDDHISALQVLALAQGPTPMASLKSARLIRRTETGTEEIPLNLKHFKNTRSSAGALQPDDILFVPSSTIRALWRHGLDNVVPTAGGIVSGLVIYR